MVNFLLFRNNDKATKIHKYLKKYIELILLWYKGEECFVLF
jgi:hypothetical protein